MAQSPFHRANVVKLKMVLPVGKERAWQLIATPEGLESWFPQKCHGKIEPGGMVKFDWKDGTNDRLKIIYVGEKHSSLRMEWPGRAQVRIYLHGKMTTLTLQVHYPKGPDGGGTIVRELPKWAFFLANLKSVALGGPDLRHHMKGRSVDQGFID